MMVSFCVFFFCVKQKTAYEMRISDWSSDVCSSDLGFGPGAKHREQPGAKRDRRVEVGADAVRRAAQRFGPVQLIFAADAGIVDEIGRASCRERVCQYV